MKTKNLYIFILFIPLVPFNLPLSKGAGGRAGVPKGAGGFFADNYTKKKPYPQI